MNSSNSSSARLASKNSKLARKAESESLKLARKQAIALLSSAVSLTPVGLSSPAAWLALVGSARVAAAESLESHDSAATLRMDFAKSSLPLFAALADRALIADPRGEPVWGPEIARLAFASANRLTPDDAIIAANAMPSTLFRRFLSLVPLSDEQRKTSALGLVHHNAPQLAAELLGSPESIISRVDPHQTQCYLSLAAESSLNFKEVKRRVALLRSGGDPETIANAWGERLALAHGDGKTPSPIGAALLAADPALLPPLKRASLRELSFLAYLFLNERDLPAYLERLDAIAPATGETLSLHPEDMRALRIASSGVRVATHAAPAAARSSYAECLATLSRVQLVGAKRAPELLANILPGVEAAFKLDPAILLRQFAEKPDHSTRLGADLAELATRCLIIAKAEPGSVAAEPAIKIFQLCLQAGFSPGQPPSGRSHSLISKLLASKNALGKAWVAAWEAQELASSLGPEPAAAPRRGMSL